MADQPPQAALEQVARPLSLAPVGLKEAAHDSPTFRATTVHFSDQVEIIERWLESYIKSTSKLVVEVSSLEETVNNFLTRAIPPSNISEAVLDHDYTLLAMRRLGEGSRDYWSQLTSAVRKMETTVVEPLKAFTTGELRNFKDARKYLDQTQKTFDNTLARYLSQSKTKEPSSLREDAFQVHETRKAYIKASLDFCILAPQLRATLDKLLVRIASDQWREQKKSRESIGNNYSKWNVEMERVRSWSRDMEISEVVFRRELQIARREIGETATNAARPSRELEDYNVSTVPFLGHNGPSRVNVQKNSKIEKSEKQGWLFQRTSSGKPARTVWIHRWFYVKHGIFGWLVQGAYSGGVEESEKIGVLLCNVRPAHQDERRFVFEVKTKNSSIFVQAETQSQLSEWLETFENAKNRALEASAKDGRAPIGEVDPAFAITQPSIPEFAAKSNEGHAAHGSEELATGTFERINTLAVPETSALASRSSVDVTGHRRSMASREEGEGSSSRDHAARIIQKLDLHRKSNAAAQVDGQPSAVAGGIASLISASHTILPSGIGQLGSARACFQSQPSVNTLMPSTLAPSTLTNFPAPTNLSKVAVIVSGEKGANLGVTDSTGGMPSGIMANIWGSTNWGYLNRLERGEVKGARGNIIPGVTTPLSATFSPADSALRSLLSENQPSEPLISKGVAPASSIGIASADASQTAVPFTAKHRKAISVDTETTLRKASIDQPEIYPINYPLQLKTQEAQFRMLFPNVPSEDKLVLVFRASWSPNETQEFPGRVYVTSKDLYFYSHHMGLCFLSGLALEYIEEVTAAAGKDSDVLFLHLSDLAARGSTRIQIKTFLEPLGLLERRLNFLIDNLHQEKPLGLEGIIAQLLKLETDDPNKSPSMESWEDISVNTPVDNGTLGGRKDLRKERTLKSTFRVEHGLHSVGEKDHITKFQLPSKAIVYEPPGFKHKVVERQFDISPKALFHVMFGDRSAVFQLLYHERRAQHITQSPWTQVAEGGLRREFHFQIDYVDVFRRAREADIVDYQSIDVLNDHICYVIEDCKVPWHLPHSQDFMLVSKIVITHVAKSKCKLAIYSKVDWSKTPTFSKGLVERQATDDMEADATDLAEVVGEQARKLGPQSRTKKAIQIFGHVGQQTFESVFRGAESGQPRRPQIKQRTLTHMLFETYASFGESCITSVLMWTFDAIKMIWKIFSANNIIIILLGMSVFINLFFTGRDVSDWWTERNAARFMNRLGVGPNFITGKAIYLKDLDVALTSDPTDFLRLSDSKCRSAFHDIANSTDMDAPYEYAGAGFLDKSTKATARRVRRTRQHLGTYRYDLLVATRVVNNIEREVMKAEWENWLLDENMRCKQVHILLEGSKLNSTSASEGDDVSTEMLQALGAKARKVENLRRWQKDYCGSCRRDHEMLFGKGGPRS